MIGTNLSASWIDRAWISLSEGPISVPGALVYANSCSGKSLWIPLSREWHHSPPRRTRTHLRPIELFLQHMVSIVADLATDAQFVSRAPRHGDAAQPQRLERTFERHAVLAPHCLNEQSRKLLAQEFRLVG